MAIERVGTAISNQILMTQLQRAEATLNRANRQIASGTVSDTYAGYGSQTAALEAARSAAARSEANTTVAEQVLSRLDLQDAQLTQLSGVVEDVRQTLTKALADSDGSLLMGQLEDLFGQAITILNAKDGASYIYGGDNDQTPPVTVATLADLAALPAVSDAFANGTVGRSARIGDNRTVEVGMLASDLATELFTLLRDAKQFDQGVSGPFGATLSQAQSSFIQNGIQTSITAHQNVNAKAAANGDRYRMVEEVIQELHATTTIYKGFAANIEDVDMGEAVARLHQAQVAMQAALHVSATIGQLSLLQFLR